MLEIKNKEACNGCSACFNVCPKNCITMKPDFEGFKYPEIDKEQCINCGLCENVCPEISSPLLNKHEKKAYAAFNKNDEIKLASSSGGVFTLIAQRVINDGGVVFGAAMSDDCKEVRHIAVETVADLVKLRGSKYVQSSINHTFKKVEEALKEGRKVLFSGTPCQVSGLYKFCKKTYENLITCDFICHGVPSPLVWQKYVEYWGNIQKNQIEKVNFRNKDFGWKSFSIRIDFEDGKKYTEKLSKDLYLRGFIANTYLRPSCHNCSFKGMDRPSDITIADFWGVEKVCPEMFDKNGTSLIVVNSSNGEELFDYIKHEMTYKEVNLKDAVKYNSAALKSAECNKSKREKFFNDLSAKPYIKVMKKYCSPTFKEKIKRTARAILRKIRK